MYFLVTEIVARIFSYFHYNLSCFTMVTYCFTVLFKEI